MPGLNKFDDTLLFSVIDGHMTVVAKGPLDIDFAGGERPMVVCVQIFQDRPTGLSSPGPAIRSKLIAECNGADHEHPDSFLPLNNPTMWSCPGHTEGLATPEAGRALATALLVTSNTIDGGFNTYTWTQSVDLKPGP